MPKNETNQMKTNETSGVPTAASATGAFPVPVVPEPVSRATVMTKSILVLSALPLSGLWSAGGPFTTRQRWELRDGQVRWQPFAPSNAAQWDEKIIRLGEQAEERRGSGAFLKLSRTSAAEATWPLPAFGACPVRDETCDHCYALGGWYRLDLSHQLDRALRLDYLRRLLREGRIDIWIEWMVGRVRSLRPIEPFPPGLDVPEHPRSTPVAYLRWHDSGDLFDLGYARAVFEVCEATPGVAHWLPTRNGQMVKLLVLGGVAVPSNLSILVSLHRGGRLEQEQRNAVREVLKVQPTARIGFAYFHNSPQKRQLAESVAHAQFGPDAVVCPCQVASDPKDRVCAGCRRCWAASTQTPIIYARS